MIRTRSTALVVSAALATAAAAAGPAAARPAAASTTRVTETTAAAALAANPGSGFVYGTDSWPGVGTGVYWYMGGPGVDPHYSGGTTEAYHWGEQQAAWTLAIAESRYIPYPVIWADIELPGIAPAPDNGWNSVYTSPCSGVKKQSYVPAVLDRTVFNGFAAYITSHSKYKVGVYSSPQIWPRIFGSGQYASIPNTYEWTYWQESSHLSDAPKGWCMGGGGGCARFFGGQGYGDKYALMWQWSGGGGVRNGYGDFDQIDDARMK